MNTSFWKKMGSKYFVFILIGLLILVVCIPTGTVEPYEPQEEEAEITKDDVEEQLEHILSSVEGVGKVKVMITTEGSVSKVFGTQNSGEQVKGVLIVAEGAGNATVNTRILDAVKALFSIDAHKISIVRMKSQEERE